MRTVATFLLLCEEQMGDKNTRLHAKTEAGKVLRTRDCALFHELLRAYGLAVRSQNNCFFIWEQFTTKAFSTYKHPRLAFQV